MKTILSIALSLLITVSLQAQTVNLKYQLDPNKTYCLKSVTQQNIVTTMQGTENNSTVNIIQVISFKQTGMDNNNLLLDIKFDTITNSSNMGGMDIQINSNNTGNVSSKNPSDLMSFFYHRFSQCTLHATMSNTGEILEISNGKLINDSVLSFTDSITGPMGKFAQSQLKSAFDASTIKSQLSAMTQYLPEKSISVGNSYEKNLTISASGMKLQTNTSYKLKKLNGGIATLSGESTFEPTSLDPVENMGMQMVFDIRGLGSNTLEIDATTGFILKSTSKIHMQGTINIVSNSMQIPMEINGTATIIRLK